MPKRARDFQKRRLGYVIACLERAMEHALELKSEFDEVLGLDGTEDDYVAALQEKAPTQHHALYALMLHTATVATYQAQEFYKTFALRAWGHVPDKVQRWTNTGQDWKEQQEDA